MTMKRNCTNCSYSNEVETKFCICCGQAFVSTLSSKSLQEISVVKFVSVAAGIAFVTVLILSGLSLSGCSSPITSMEEGIPPTIISAAHETAVVPSTQSETEATAELVPTLTIPTAPTDEPTQLGPQTDQVADPGGRINKDSADRIAQIAQWGRGDVTNVSYSPDGRFIAVDTTTGTFLYNADSLEEISHFPTSGYVWSSAFSPDGELIALGVFEGPVQLWDISENSLVAEHDVWLAANGSVAFSSTGQALAAPVGWTGTLQLWDGTHGTPLLALDKINERVSDFAFSPDGTRVATVRFEGMGEIWDASSGELLVTLQGPVGKAREVSFLSEGNILVTKVDDYGAQMWNADDGTLIRTLNPQGVHLAKFIVSPDDQYYAMSLGDGSAFLGKLIDGSIHLELGPDNAWSIAFSPDGNVLATGSANGTIQLWNSVDGTAISTLQGHDDRVKGVNFSPDGQTLASWSDDDTILLRSLDGGTFATVPGFGPWGADAIAISNDGNSMAASLSNGAVSLIDIPEGTTQAILPAAGHVIDLAFSSDDRNLIMGIDSGAIQTWDLSATPPALLSETQISQVADFLVFSPDARYLATINLGGGAVYLWRTEEGSLVTTLDVENDYVDNMAFSADGNTFATDWSDQVVRLWNTADGSVINTIPVDTDLIKGLSISPDGQMVAVGGLDGSVQVWHVASGQPITPSVGGHVSSVTLLAFSPDGQLLASASEDKSIRLWAWGSDSSYQTFRPLIGHTLFIEDIEFTPNGEILISTGRDGTTRLWGIR